MDKRHDSSEPTPARPGAIRGFRLALVGGACLTVLLGGCSAVPGPGGRTAASGPVPGIRSSAPAGAADPSAHRYVGMWVTADGHIRQQLFADGRYAEARGARESAYTGSYRVSGNRISYVDDTGFTADGTFEGNVLHHGGYTFHRQGAG